MSTKIETARVGRKKDDTFVVIINGMEIGDLLPESDANKIAEWLRANIIKLEGIL